MILIIGCTKPHEEYVLTKAVESFAQCRVVKADVQTFLALPELDAALVLGALAHERFGGSPSAGLSQIISTRGTIGLPKWLVTIPAASGSLTFNKGVATIEASQDWNMEREFREIITAINNHNKDTLFPINKLGIHIELANLESNSSEWIEDLKHVWLNS